MFLNYPNPIKFEQGNAKHISFFLKQNYTLNLIIYLITLYITDQQKSVIDLMSIVPLYTSCCKSSCTVVGTCNDQIEPLENV